MSSEIEIASPSVAPNEQLGVKSSPEITKQAIPMHRPDCPQPNCHRESQNKPFRCLGRSLASLPSPEIKKRQVPDDTAGLPTSWPPPEIKKKQVPDASFSISVRHQPLYSFPSSRTPPYCGPLLRPPRCRPAGNSETSPSSGRASACRPGMC